MASFSSLLKSVVSTKALDTALARALIQAAQKDGRISSSERSALKSALEKIPLLAPEVRSQLEAVFGADVFSPAKPPVPPVVINPVDLPDPAIGDPSLRFQRQTGTAIVGGISSADVKQGNLGDCYFLAAVASWAEAYPEDLAKRIKDNGDGTYDISFMRGEYQRAADGSYQWAVKPDVVRVDGDLPVRSDGGLAYAQAPQGELWVALFEKAYAQLWKDQGGYQAIGHGGDAGEVMRTLDGGTYRERLPVGPKVSDADLLKAIRFNLEKKTPMVAATASSDVAQGIVAKHAYSLLGVAEKDGVVQVELRNPWGKTEPGADGRDDGRFWMPWTDFKRSFVNVYQ